MLGKKVKMNQKNKSDKIEIIKFSTWKNRHITKEQAEQIIKEIKEMLNRPDIKKIAAPEFRDRRSYNKYNINFNGCGEKKFETFTFYTEYKNSKAQELVEALTDKQGTFNKITRVLNLNGELKECKCWVNNNPYSKAVMEALKIIQKISKNALKIEIK